MGNTSAKISFGLLVLSLTACGGTTPFQDSELGRYAINVSSEAPSGDQGKSYAIEDGAGSDDTQDNETIVDTELAAVSEDESDDNAVPKGKKDKTHPSESKENQQTAGLCGKLFRGKAEKLVILSPNEMGKPLNLDATTVIAARLSGNQENLNLTLSGVESLAGICIIATGNQPKVTIVSEVNVSHLAYIARGNQGEGSIVLQTEKQINTSYIELKGNGQSLTLEGLDGSHCDNAVIKGNAANKIECKASVE